MEQQQQQNLVVVGGGQDHLSLLLLLPAEILVEIFSYFGPTDVFHKISLTCRRFRDIVSGHSAVLWSAITIPHEMGVAAASRWIQMCCGSLTKLAIQDRLEEEKRLGEAEAAAAAFVIVDCALRKCRRLRVLDFNPSLTSPVLLDIGKWGGSLRTLYANFYPLYLEPSKHDADLANLRNLTKLQIFEINDELLMFLADHCGQRLQDLTVEATEISAAGWTYYFERAHRTIRRLAIWDYYYHEQSLRWMARCTELEDLDLTCIMRWEPAAFMLLSELTNLRSLKMHFDQYCPPEGINGAKDIFHNGGQKRLTNFRLAMYGICNFKNLTDFIANICH